MAADGVSEFVGFSVELAALAGSVWGNARVAWVALATSAWMRYDGGMSEPLRIITENLGLLSSPWRRRLRTAATGIRLTARVDWCGTIRLSGGCNRRCGGSAGDQNGVIMLYEVSMRVGVDGFVGDVIVEELAPVIALASCS